MSFAKRLWVPVAVVAMAALVVALGPSLLARARPSLPSITAEQLLVSMQRADIDGLSGTIETHSDLGLPELPGMSGQTGGGQGGPPWAEEESRGDQPQQPSGGGPAAGMSPQDLLTGDHTLRVAMAGPDKQRLAILDELSQRTLVHNGRDVWAYDSESNRAVHWQLPQGQHHSDDAAAKDRDRKHSFWDGQGTESMTPSKVAQRFLSTITPSTNVTVTGTDSVAGRDVYTLALSPRSTKSMIGSVEIAVDAEKRIPLAVTVTPRGGGPAAIDVGFTDVAFGEPSASRFTFTPPDNAQVKQKDISGGHWKAEQGQQGWHGWQGRHDKSDGADDEKAHREDWQGKDNKGKGPWSTDDAGSPTTIGKGWTSVLVLEGNQGQRYRDLMTRLGKPVQGEFGQGTLIHTRLLNALVTDDGRVYVGAVTQQALSDAAAEQA